MRTLTFLAAVLAFGLVACVPAAAAATGQTAVIPWGEWVGNIIAGSAVIAGSVVAWGLRQLPRHLRFALMAARVDQLLERAVQYGINSVAGAVRGQALEVRIGNEVARLAVEYANQHAPQLVEEIGNSRIWEKVMARLELTADATIAPPAVTAQR